MATKTLAKNGTRPLYEFGRIWRWVEYPAHDLVGEDFPYLEQYEGFAVEVLVNPLGEVERAGQVALREHVKRLTDLTQTDPNNQEKVEDSEFSYLEVLAPRIRAWNAAVDGQALPAPADPGGFEALCLFPDHLRGWIAAVVRQVTIPKRMTPTSSPAGSTAITPPGPTVEPPPLDRPRS